MKKTFLIFCFLTTIVIATKGQLVYDKSKDYQIKSMVFQQWKFNPEWYYYYVWQDELGFTWPGLGTHHIYADESSPKMNILYLTPTVVASELSEADVKKADKEYETVYNQELIKFADRTIDAEYLLVKDDLNFIKELIGNEMGKFVSNKISLSTAEPLYREYDRINNNLEIIKDSHLENAKRRKAYFKIEKEFQQLNLMCMSLNKINKHTNRVDKYLNNE